jgi:hypothetical protein
MPTAGCRLLQDQEGEGLFGEEWEEGVQNSDPGSYEASLAAGRPRCLTCTLSTIVQEGYRAALNPCLPNGRNHLHMV